MSEEELHRRLRRAYLGEVGGAAFFRGYAEATADPEHSRKAQLLHRLEVVTRARVGERLTEPVSEQDQAAVAQASSEDGAAAARSGWEQMLRNTLEVAPGALAGYDKIAKLDGGEKIGRMLIEHELALTTFCELELQGIEDAESCVAALLLDDAAGGVVGH